MRQSLEAAYQWICAAQDATPDGGVSALYDLFHGWSASYPETTGYIIPTLLAYASSMSMPEARRRAIRMAEWEIEVQLPTGAVRSGTVASKVGPAVFNTGQVLHGWTAVYSDTMDKQYEVAIRRAAEWLLRVQDEDGAWRTELSLMTSSKVQTYNIRTAWGLAIAGELLGEPKWTRAARKNADWCFKQQHENGWFEHNGFTEDEFPLLHTIAYTLEGMLGVGTFLRQEEYIQAARRGLEPLVRMYEQTGKFVGRYRPDWEGAVSWRCLTGEAQVALTLLMLAKYHVNDGFGRQMAIRILHDLAGLQETESSHAETYGGLTGSEPIWSDYIPYSYLNWAVKFYMDGLLMTVFDCNLHGLDNSIFPSDQVSPRTAANKVEEGARLSVEVRGALGVSDKSLEGTLDAD